MFVRYPETVAQPLPRVLGAMSVLVALSCSAVLGLDEPTHRNSNQLGGGGDAGSGGASNGGSGSGNAGDLGAAGSQASGGTMGMGGSASGGGGPGGGGPGGAGGAAGSPDAGGAGAAKDAGVDAGRMGCAGLLCDDFEGPAVGARPDPAKWVVDPQTIPPITIAIDSARARGGTKSVRTQSLNGSYGPMMFNNATSLNALNIGNVWYIRFHAFITDLGRPGGLLAIREVAPVAGTMRSLVLGVYANGVMAYSIAQDATIGNATIIPNSGGPLMTSFRAPAAAWFCMEVQLDVANKTIQTWANGVDIPVLRADGMPTMGVDDTWPTVGFNPAPFVRFGWWPSGGMIGDTQPVYIDDVAISASRIGCN